MNAAAIAYAAKLLDLPLQEADPDEVDPFHYINQAGDEAMARKRFLLLQKLARCNFGAAVKLSGEDMIQLNADEAGTKLTPEIWVKLGEDMHRLENNAMSALRQNGLNCSDCGHDTFNELVISCWFAKNQEEADLRGVYLVRQYLLHEEPISTSSGTWDSFLGSGSTQKLYEGTSEYGQMIEVDLEIFDLGDVKRLLEDGEELLGESADPDNVDVGRYLADITGLEHGGPAHEALDLGTFAKDATNFGLNLPQVNVWGRWVILFGYTYWAYDLDDQPISQLGTRKLVTEYTQKYGITGYKLQVYGGGNGASAFCGVKLGVPAHYFSDQSLADWRAYSHNRAELDRHYVSGLKIKESDEELDNPEALLRSTSHDVLISNGFTPFAEDASHSFYKDIQLKTSLVRFIIRLMRSDETSPDFSFVAGYRSDLQSPMQYMNWRPLIHGSLINVFLARLNQHLPEWTSGKYSTSTVALRANDLATELRNLRQSSLAANTAQRLRLRNESEESDTELDMPRAVGHYLTSPDLVRLLKDLNYWPIGKTEYMVLWNDSKSMHECYQKVYVTNVAVALRLCQGVIGVQFFIHNNWEGFRVSMGDDAFFHVKDAHHAATVLKAMDRQLTQLVANPKFDPDELGDLIVNTCRSADAWYHETLQNLRPPDQ